jgi:hypothetical protein
MCYEQLLFSGHHIVHLIIVVYYFSSIILFFNTLHIRFYCLTSLVSIGVFEAVRIRKQGFPFRLPHQQFIDRYECIAPGVAGKVLHLATL